MTAPAQQPPAPQGPPELTPDGLAFRQTMSHLASGVVMVTGAVDGRAWGMTVSSACPVCLTPPTMLVSLGSHTVLSKVLGETGRFGVSVLGQEALHVARFGSAPGTPKFLDEGLGLVAEDHEPTAMMVPGALGHVDCEVVEMITHRTHVLFLGRVLSTVQAPASGPLLHYDRDFWQLGEAA
jgi:flavin reductase (DIM6/NTAB) family NADH-FMN oxidoreductase RutF